MKPADPAVRVCLVTSSHPPDWSGVAKLTHNLAVALRGRDAAVEVVTFTARDAPERTSETDSDGSGPDADGVVRVEPLWRRGALLGGARTAVAALRAMWGPAGRAEVVHVHGYSLLTRVAALVARLRRRPLVWSLHGRDGWDHRPGGLDLFGRIARGADRVVFISDGLRAHVEASTGPLAATVIPAGVHWDAAEAPAADARDAVRADLDLPDAPVFYANKNFFPDSGSRTMVEAFARTADRVPGSVLLYSGLGPLREDARALARERGVADRVRFLDPVDEADLWRHYTAADVYVVPTDRESFATTVLESLWCGTPVVSTASVGPAELAATDLGDWIRLAPVGDAPALADAMVAAAEERRRVPASVRDVLRERYDRAAVAGLHLELYRDVVASRAGGSQAVTAS